MIKNIIWKCLENSKVLSNREPKFVEAKSWQMNQVSPCAKS